ncbi:endo-1,4-beta-xylanase [Paenibacillus sp. FSL R5-0470]|uniref:endo-1,4-beta-xylanase n=1 Tax=Paenibacillus sp. FSL R5-0470 TaxID=2921641 RepID=UPI0030DBDA2A
MNKMLKQVISILLAIAILIPSGLFAPVTEAATSEIPVLLYHRIVDTATNEWTDTSADKFKSTMKYLYDNGYNTLTADQYVNIKAGVEAAPAKPILLTFDDGTPDFVTKALPVLDQYDMNAVAFIVTGWIGKGYSMSQAQLQDLATNHPNISIQNHTVNHAEGVWKTMTKAEASAELAEANNYLKQITNKDPILLAYPYGDFNSDVQAAAAANGIKYSFKVGYPNQGDYASGRYYVQMGTTLSDIANWIGGPAPDTTAPSTSVTVYHESFSNGKGVATQSGNASLTTVTDKVFAGNADGAALYVSNRANDWDAADFDYSGIKLVDGKTYTVTASVYVDENVNVPSGAQAFIQSIGSYDVVASANYEAGKAITLIGELIVDTSKNTKLRIQSNASGKEVSFYIGDLLITEQVTTEEPTREPALPFTTVTFEDQKAGGFVGRAGTETLTVSNEANHTDGGSYALKVEGRADTWHGPSLRVEKNVDKGQEYKISLWVKLIEPASSQLKLSTQVGNTSASYNTLASKTISNNDDWVQLQGTYRYSSVSEEYLTIYVESSDAIASFYIDDIRFENTGSGTIEIEKDLAPIKDTYKNDFLIGNAISGGDLDGLRLDLLKMHHNIVTAENAMKPDQAYSSPGVFDFTAQDKLVDKILSEGLKLHGHVLVWHAQTPDWLNTTTDVNNNKSPLSREEALQNLRTHIKTVMEHFGDKVISWDVVNEAMNDNPSNPTDWKAALRTAPWKSAIGTDYVEQAFLAAREVLDSHPEWNIKLYYNDYNDDNQNKAQAIYSMVKEINDKYALEHPGKLLVDGIGMQAHYNINTNPENVKLSLEKFISLGVEVSITELDIMAGSDSKLTEQQANAQGYLYAQLFKIYKDHAKNISRVTFWGLNDGTSWRSENNPLPFDANLQAKPAYYGVIDPDKFIAEHTPESVNANQSTAKYATPVIDGVVDAVWNDAAPMLINRYQMAWQGANGVAKALWDDENLYLLVQVNDTQLNKSSVNEYEQDSVEIFLDQNNAKTSFYQSDDGQYRVNYDNETSFNPTSIAAGFESATQISGTNYTVEVKIPLHGITPDNDKKLGFDVQINDAKDGSRQSVAAWNDTTGTGYMDTSVYGVLTLKGKATDTEPTPTPAPTATPTPTPTPTPAPTNEPTGSSNTDSAVTTPQPVAIAYKDGVVTITLEVKSDNGRAIGTISSDNLKKALEQATAAANGKKQIVIEVPKQTDAKVYDIQLPTQSLMGKENFELLLKTENATIQIPSNMLPDLTDLAEQVSIRISKVSADSLSAANRNLIGSHPVIDLSVVSGDKVIPWNNPNAPVTVSIPYTPTAEELSNPDLIVVWYIDDNGNVVPVPNGRYDAATQTVVFQTTHFSIYAITIVKKNFGDLQNVSWAKQAIDVMAARDVIQGTSANSFSPADSMKRADFIALLVRALELKGTGKSAALFSDVQKTDYYYDELVIAKELGIVTGFADDTFRPNSDISRQDMMVLTTRALAASGKQVKASGTLNAYLDEASISSYAKDSALLLIKAGVVNGKNDRIAPNDTLTRAEAAVILYRIWKL